MLRRRGGACSGYLIEEDGFGLLLDCGNGVFSKLRNYRDYVDVGAVLISHLHADHLLDLVPFSYALMYAPRQQPVAVGGWPGTDTPARPALYAPKGAGDMFRHLVECWGDEELVERAFNLCEYDGPDELSIGPFAVRFCEVPHYIRAFAAELTTRHFITPRFGYDVGLSYANVTDRQTNAFVYSSFGFTFGVVWGRPAPPPKVQP